MAGKVMIGYVHPGTVRAEFMQSVIGILTNEKTGLLVGGVAEASAGALVAIARDLLTAQFLESPCEWLWCVDTDMVFAPVVLETLAAVADETRRPIVSALCPILDHGRIEPSAFTVTDDGGEPDIRRLTDVPQGVLMPVAAVGAACLLVHRRVFEEIAKAEGYPTWWRQIETGAGVQLGEDVSFCLRAGGAGFPVWLDTRLQVGHVRTIIIGEITDTLEDQGPLPPGDRTV